MYLTFTSAQQNSTDACFQNSDSARHWSPQSSERWAHHTELCSWAPVPRGGLPQHPVCAASSPLTASEAQEAETPAGTLSLGPCGVTVKWELQLARPRKGWWSICQLPAVSSLLWSGSLSMWPLCRCRLGFLSAWYPQGHQTVCLAAQGFRSEGSRRHSRGYVAF